MVGYVVMGAVVLEGVGVEEGHMVEVARPGAGTVALVATATAGAEAGEKEMAAVEVAVAKVAAVRVAEALVAAARVVRMILLHWRQDRFG